MGKMMDLAKPLVGKYGLGAKEAEHFVSMMFEVLHDGLRDERLVKIKGLGTFKMMNVSPRESVDVNTGERITLEGREKISFTPEASMRDRVNAPFSQFETVVVNEGVDFSEIDRKYQDSLDRDIPENTPDTTKTPVKVSKQENIEDHAVEDHVVEDQAVEDHAVEDHVVEDQAVEDHAVEDQAVEDHAVEDQAVEDHESLVLSMAQMSLLNQDCSTHEESIIPKENTAELEDVSPASHLQQEENVDTATPSATVLSQEEVLLQQEDVSTDIVRLELQNEQLVRQVDLHHRLVRWLLASIIALLLLACVGAYYLGKQVAMRDHRIMYLEMRNRQGQASAQVSNRVTEDTIHRDSLNREALRMKQQQKEEEIQKKAAEEEKQRIMAEKAVEEKRVTEEKREAKMQAEYERDVRVRTGAYRIKGTATTVTVRKGQTLQSISRSYLGPDMECYVEALNGKTVVKEGDELKIPELVLKKAK